MTDDSWRKFKITPREWVEFEALAKSEVGVWGFVQDKLRYVYFWVARETMLILTVWTSTRIDQKLSSERPLFLIYSS